jgi:hypothetical protein
MLKDDINVGDLLRTDIDLPHTRHIPVRSDGHNPERLVLVVSVDGLYSDPGNGYVGVLDCGIMTDISCVWLWPGDGCLDGSSR